MAVNAFGDTIEDTAPATTAFGDPIESGAPAPEAPHVPAPPVTSFGDPVIETPVDDRYAGLAGGASPFAPATPEPSSFAAPGLDTVIRDTNNAGGFTAFLQPLDNLQASGLAQPMNAGNILASMGKPDVWLAADDKRKNREKLIGQVGDDVLADLLIQRAKVTRQIESLPNEKGEAGGLGQIDSKALHNLTVEQGKLDAQISEREAARPTPAQRREAALVEAQSKLSPGIVASVDGHGNFGVTAKVNPTAADNSVLKDLETKLAQIKQMELPGDKRQALIDDLAKDQTPGGVAFNQFLGAVTEQLSGVTGLTKRIFGVDRKPGDFETAMSEIGGLEKAVAARDTSALGAIGRGVGTVGGLMAGGPAGRAGLVVGALRAGTEAYASTLEQTADEGKALKAAGEVVPGMLLFLGVGKVAGGFASSLAADSSVAVKTLASFTGATLANIGSSAVLRALAAEPGQEGKAAMPTVETLTADTLFAVFHAKGDYEKASKEAKVKALIELRRRGFTAADLEKGAGEEIEGKAPADAVIPEPPEVAEAKRAEAARKQALLESAAKSAEIAGMPLTAEAAKAEAAKQAAAAAAPEPEPAPEPPKPAAQPGVRPPRPPLSGPIAEIHRPEVDLIARLRSPYEAPREQSPETTETEQKPAGGVPKQDAPTSEAPESAVPPVEGARDLTSSEQSQIDSELEREQREAEEEYRREQEQERARLSGEVERSGASHELLDAIRRIGGLPSMDRDASLTGETRRLWETNKGHMMRLANRSQRLSLDQVRQDLEQYGFQFETPDAMLEAIERRMVTGKEQFGFEPGDSESRMFGSRRERVDAEEGISLRDSFDEEDPETWPENLRKSADPENPVQEVDREDWDSWKWSLTKGERAWLDNEAAEEVSKIGGNVDFDGDSKKWVNALEGFDREPGDEAEFKAADEMAKRLNELADKAETEYASRKAEAINRFMALDEQIKQGFLFSATPATAENTFRARLLQAAEQAPSEAELDAAGKQPSTVEFERPDRAGVKVVLQNTREALQAAADRYRPAAPATHLQRIGEVIEEAKQRFQGVRIRVLRNEGDLTPAERRGLEVGAIHEGLADVGRGNVYLFTDNISSPQRALEVLAHEISHIGVEKLVTEPEWKSLADSIIGRLAPNADAELTGVLADIASKYTRANSAGEMTPQERTIVAREYVARLAEKPSINPPLWQKVVDTVRRALRALGSVKTWTENDIRDLLKRAERQVEAKAESSRVVGGDVLASIRDLGKEVEAHSPYASEVERAYHEAVPNPDARAAIDEYVKAKLAGQEELPPLSDEERATADKFLQFFKDKQDFAARNGVNVDVPTAAHLGMAERLAVFSSNVNKATAARTQAPPPGAEPRAPSAGGDRGPTSIKNAVVDQERASRGLPRAIEPARRSFGSVWDEAMALIDRDSTVQERLVDELAANPRNVEDWEDALLLHRQIELQNAHDRAVAEFLAARDAGDQFAAESAKARGEDISNRLLKVYDVGKAAGTAAGRALNARKMMANEDFSLAKMVAQKRVDNDGEQLTPEQHKEVVELHQKIADLQRQIAANDAAKAERESNQAAADAMKAMVEQVEKEAKAAPAPEKKVSVSKKVVAAIEKKAAEARERIRARAGSVNIGLNPAELLDYSIIAAEYFVKGSISIGRLGAKLILEFGEAVRPHIPEIFAKAKQIAEEAKSERDLPAERTAIIEGMRERTGEGDTLKDLGAYVRKLSLNLVRSGVTDREALIDTVHADLFEIDPEFTRRQAMDLISGYGEFKPLDPEAAKVQLRDLKGQMQQIGKLEDMASGKAPLKTGVQQREKSEVELKLVKEVNEAKKKGGFEVTDPATQLKSALAARERALSTEIKRIQEEIATGVKRKAPSKPPTSPEVEALRTQLAELRAEREAIFGKPEMTDEQRLAVAIKAADRSTAEYERQARESDFAGKGKPALTSPELEAAKARRDAARAHRDELRALDIGVKRQKEAARTKQLEASIAELDRKLRTGDTDPEKQTPPLLTPEQEALVSERDAMLKLLAEIRRKPGKSDALKQVERLGKQISDLDRRLRDGDLSSKGKPKVAPLSPEAARLMAERDARVRALQNLRDAAKPRLSPHEIALKRWKSVAANRIRQIADRMARGEWEPRPRMPMILDPEGDRIAFDLEKAKEEFVRGRFEDMLRRRSWLPSVSDKGEFEAGKILGTTGEVINTARAVMTAFDLSAVLRQGGFIVMAHPVRGLRAFPAMFQAFGLTPGNAVLAAARGLDALSKGRPVHAVKEVFRALSEYGERAAHAVQTEIESRPNAHLYTQAKLDLTKPGVKLTDMEEAYMSRWAKKIPLVAGSERAYRTFLNRLRADSFDAMMASFGRRGGASLREARAIANFVNVATGRGSLGPKLATAAVGLNHVFFAPRLVLSRFQLLTGQPLWDGSMATRRAIAGEYARYLVGVGVVIALAQAAGADKMETDPRSSNFGKLKFGHTRVDPFSGLLQATVVSSRVLSGSTKTSKGAIVKLRTAPGEKRAFGQDDAGDVIGRFLRSKLSPVAGTAMDIASGRNVIGEPVTPGMAATRMFVPLTFGEVYESMKEKGVGPGAAFAVLTIFGAGVQTYDEKAKRKP